MWCLELRLPFCDQEGSWPESKAASRSRRERWDEPRSLAAT